MRALGDSYVREEFRRHRTASATFLQPFFTEWQAYAGALRSGSASGGLGDGGASVGRDLAPEQAASLSKEQQEQLARLREEAATLAR